MALTDTDGILVVCTANVCRSPMAEFAIRRRLVQRPGFESVSVSSAGLRVPGEAPVCGDVAAFRKEELWRQMASEHRARLLDLDQVRRAALVVAATRELRSSVVAAIPEYRSKVFTLREAVWLGAGYVRDSGVDPASSAAAFQQHIDGQRGLRPLPRTPRFAPWLGIERDRLDISDGHGRRSAAHFAALRGALAAADDLADLIAAEPR